MAKTPKKSEREFGVTRQVEKKSTKKRRVIDDDDLDALERVVVDTTAEFESPELPPKRRRGRPRKDDPRYLVAERQEASAPRVETEPTRQADAVEPASAPTEEKDDDATEAERRLRVVLKRQWDMLQTLAVTREGMTLEGLAKKFNVSEKTIKRDLKSLEYVFGALKTKNEAHGRKRYSYDSNPFSFALSLDRDELLTIYVGQTLMTPLRGTYFWDNLQSSREKIKKILREDAVKYAERVAPFFYRFEPTEMHYTAQMRRLIDKALVAMVKSCALRIKYRSLKAQRSKTYDVYPYNFISWNNSIYLIGYCCRDSKIKIWKVDRLHDATTLPARKFKRANFDVEKYLSNVVAPFVGETPVKRVTLRFTGYAARIVEEEKLRSICSCRREPSGAIVVEMDTEPGKAFTRWVLGFGRHAEILAPPELRDEFRGELETLRELYLRDVNDPVAFYEEYERDYQRDRAGVAEPSEPSEPSPAPDPESRELLKVLSTS